MVLPIYLVEQTDGLSDSLKQSKISWASMVCPEKKFDLSPDFITRAKHFCNAENPNQLDLYYFRSILVTTGWNLNKDVFDPKETFAARFTPEDKPVNFEHDSSDIIGHHTFCRVIDDSTDLKEIDSNTPVDILPDKFHLMTRAVLYKIYDKPEAQERINSIIASIPRNEWFVSMEAHFNDFDYALLNRKTGESKIVARNNGTAFLTKYLSAYGGNGVYQEYEIGRLLRGITFIGAGLVKNPANPDSIIFAKTIPIKNNLVYSLNKEKVMAEVKLDEILAKLTERDNRILALEKQIADSNVSATQSKIDELARSLEATQKTVTELTSKNQELVKNLGLMTAERDEVKKTSESTSNELKVAQTKLTDMVSAKRKADRLAAVGSYIKDTGTAEKIVSSLNAVADEDFNVYVESHKNLVKADTSKPDKALDTAVVKPDVTAVVTDPDAEVNKVFAEISDLISGSEESEE